MQDGQSEYPLPVPWLREFFAIPEEFGLSRSTSFQSGRVYGMDVTSGAAVAALLFNSYDVCKEGGSTKEVGKSLSTLRVLDLCCAPG